MPEWASSSLHGTAFTLRSTEFERYQLVLIQMAGWGLFLACAVLGVMVVPLLLALPFLTALLVAVGLVPGMWSTAFAMQHWGDHTVRAEPSGVTVTWNLPPLQSRAREISNQDLLRVTADGEQLRFHLADEVIELRCHKPVAEVAALAQHLDHLLGDTPDATPPEPPDALVRMVARRGAKTSA